MTSGRETWNRTLHVRMVSMRIPRCSYHGRDQEFSADSVSSTRSATFVRNSSNRRSRSLREVPHFTSRRKRRGVDTKRHGDGWLLTLMVATQGVVGIGKRLSNANCHRVCKGNNITSDRLFELNLVQPLEGVKNLADSGRRASSRVHADQSVTCLDRTEKIRPMAVTPRNHRSLTSLRAPARDPQGPPSEQNFSRMTSNRG